MKQFIRQFTDKKELKGASKQQLADSIFADQEEVVNFQLRKSFKDRETRDVLYEIMVSKPFIKGFKEFVKNKHDEYDVSPVWSIIISELLGNKFESLDEDVVATYDKIVAKLLKPQVKALASKAGISREVATELLVVAPCKEISENHKVTNIYVTKVLRKLYMVANEVDLKLTSTQLKDIFKFIFEKDVLGEVAITILLERKTTISGFSESQLRVWNLVTSYALDILTKRRSDISELLGKYYAIKNSSKGNDGARRINLEQLPQEDYPKLYKAMKKADLIK